MDEAVEISMVRRHRLWIFAAFTIGLVAGAILYRGVLADVKGFEPIPSCAPIVDSCAKR